LLQTDSHPLHKKNNEAVPVEDIIHFELLTSGGLAGNIINGF
jgi:hypothetical protein